jgi:response regulator NasT
VTTDTTGLRILAADEDQEALRRTADVLEDLGHRVTAFAVDVRAAAERIAAEEPDLAVVVVHRDDAHALALIAEISAYASGPVIALLHSEDPAFIARAAEAGVDAYAHAENPADLQSAIEVAVRRRSETTKLAEQVDQLEGALDRRGIIERAKGILMERHALDERSAFELVRSHARGNNRTVVDTARSVLEGHALLPKA